MTKPPKALVLPLSKVNWDELQEALKREGVPSNRRAKTLRKVLLGHFGILPTRSLWASPTKGGTIRRRGGGPGRPPKADQFAVCELVEEMAGATKPEMVRAVMAKFGVSKATGYRTVSTAEASVAFFSNSESPTNTDDANSKRG